MENIKKTKQQRVDIINEIIKEISNTGRNFFRNKDRVAFIFIKSNKLYFYNQNTEENLYLSSNKISKPYAFPHGGTIWALTKDFKEFIITGKKCNGENGYGGLFCTHWGYSPEEMKIIQDKAVELGYL